MVRDLDSRHKQDRTLSNVEEDYKSDALSMSIDLARLELARFPQGTVTPTKVDVCCVNS